MNRDALRTEISDFLRFNTPEIAEIYEIIDTVAEHEYIRHLISYRGEEGDEIRAFLLIPNGKGPFPAVILHHQHNNQQFLGKSEVCGLQGDPQQAFGPDLARKGMVVLAPDSIGFEDRRQGLLGTEPNAAMDGLQYYLEMCYRLLVGDFLMHKIIQDAALAVSQLSKYPSVDPLRIGTLGHGYGGTTALFHAALDTRVRFTCVSGSAFIYKNKMIERATIEMAEVIPGFIKRFDIQDLIKCIAPRRILLVSATEDHYTKDAEIIIKLAKEAFTGLGITDRLEHKKFIGGRTITSEEFKYMAEWMAVSSKEVLKND